MAAQLFENEYGTVYADHLRLPSLPGDAEAFDDKLIPLSTVLRVAWLYDIQASPRPGPLSTLRFWMLALVGMTLLMMPIANWWAFSSRRWRVAVTLKSGGFVRSAHRDSWAKAEAFAKVARQTAKGA